MSNTPEVSSPTDSSLEADLPAPPAASATPAVIDAYLQQLIARLRLKLLDLTTRNPLLSYKHPARGGRFIRIIDELPDQLYARLDNENTLRFKGLGEESNEPEDEKSIIFRRALDAAKLTDEQYRADLTALGDDPGDKPLAHLELELRIRVRQSLAMPPRKATTDISIADVAKKKGLEPSFDLPTSPPIIDTEEAPSKKHGDNYLQTLMYDEPMERSLARIRDRVRLSLDETGVNELFCVFGFLEWYEDGSSEKPLYAPLLLFPLAIDRKLERGHYQYTVRSSGEGAQANVALAERLKRDFQIHLPPYGQSDDDTPEKYFAAVHAIIETNRGWKVRRFVTVGLFSFARIAMYHDLAPEHWATVGGLSNRTSIRRVFAGESDAEAPLQQLDAAQDPPNSSNELDTTIISEADSSQLEAVTDVLAGRSLVIEGPPGTGKSQTITNIIAALLDRGKTVLFLAEKMAALNVVKDRLKHAQLGDFCFELHSTKSGKKEVYEALSRRIDGDRPRAVNRDLAATLQRLNELRQALTERADALNQPAGKLSISMQTLLWRCNASRTKTAQLPLEVDSLLLPGAEELLDMDAGRIVAIVEQFERSRMAIVAEYGSIQAHPWHGAHVDKLDAFHVGDALRAAQGLSTAAGAIDEFLTALATSTGVALPTIGAIAALAPAADIRDPAAAAPDAIIGAMADPQTLAALHQFATDVAEYRNLATSTTALFADASAATACSASDLTNLTAALSTASLTGTVAELATIADKRRREVTAWAAAVALLDRIHQKVATSATLAELTSATSAQSSSTPAAERALLAAVDLAAEATTGVPLLHLRTAPLATPGASLLLGRAQQRATELLAKRETLYSQFVLEAATDTAQLHRHAATLRAAGLFAFLQSPYREAVRYYKGLCKTPQKASAAQKAAQLDAIAEFHAAVTSHATDPDLIALLGPTFRGISTDIEPHLRTTQWCDRVRQQLPSGDPFASQLQQLLLGGPATPIESLAAAASDPSYAILRKVVGPNAAHSVAAQASAANVRSDATGHAAAVIAQLKLRPQVSVTDLPRLATDIARLRELQRHLAESRTAATVLTTAFQGAATDTAPLCAAAEYVHTIQQSKLDPQLQRYLIALDARAHLGVLRPLAAQSGPLLAAFDAAIARLHALAPLDFPTWIGVSSPHAASAGQLRDHATRCATDEDGLQSLIDDARLLREVESAGLGPLIALLEANNLPLVNLADAARRVIDQTIVRAMIASYPCLANFTGDRQDRERAEFAELDRKLQRLRQSKIAAQLVRATIDEGVRSGPKSAWSGKSLIDNERSKQRGHVAIRNLLDRAGLAAQQLMPCFMMSPLSVAQFLKPDGLRFDVVIMDEASQMRPEDAIGAMARGEQLVIVGDPKQLPPTNFFRSFDETETDDLDDDSASDKSILDEALGVLRPARRLKWHYRSRHESLIAFSNKEFYNNELVIFPSPFGDRPDYGVRYEFIAEGKYRSSVNPIEAQKVAAAAITYAKSHPERTLGLVTLNQPQAELLTMEIDRLAAEDEVFEAWRKARESTLEPFFVKNLENVQGDERDTIFISTVYGPDEQGAFHQRFGPINAKGGQRRLNVLYTRSKCQTIVFTSMDPGAIRADATSANQGVRALKGYLQFAKNGLLDLSLPSGRPPDSDFEMSVAAALRAAGYDVVPQVGVAGYFIDLGVTHPTKPGEFVLGIECDGATYHSTASARDRDRLRQEVLERLLWRIHRIWSLDWYRNPKRETERLLKAAAAAVGVPALTGKKR